MKSYRLSAFSFAVISAALSLIFLPLLILFSFDVLISLLLFVLFSVVSEVIHVLVSPIKSRDAKWTCSEKVESTD